MTARKKAKPRKPPKRANKRAPAKRRAPEKPTAEPKKAAPGVEPLSAAKEKFAHALALGAEQASAYRQALPGTRAKPGSIWTEASKWAADPKVRQRVAELHAEARERAAKAHVYEYEDAMREVDEALQIAKFMLDSSAMSKAVDLKAKLSGLHVDPRANARDPFEGKTDAELLAMARADAEELAKAGTPLH